ncbi:MAG: molybdenum cofactor guanylyltransferase [Planctomycetes bacterium]|nr:molybdenum cofactor guanylyltransferase [Planctomycetota bacterium]
MAGLDATAIIMAGGQSRRMGRDKGLLAVSGEPMIKRVFGQLRPHFRQILVSAADEGKYAFLGVRVVVDAEKGRGPLMGIASSLRVSENDLNFVVACDIPEIDIDLVGELLGQAGDYDAVIPTSGPKRPEPLFAVYSKASLPAIEKALSEGKNRVLDGVAGCRVKYVELAEGRVIRNINTIDDYNDFIDGPKR